ncbi:hypothetical protein [Solimonas variicoloris]|uniref:hypothetical protein n=1 Tax=Solimonas variicoloris TaxID=254408 RepID=UPI00037F61FF|nr:hypothetical protein [Solimonas variicoloris]
MNPAERNERHLQLEYLAALLRRRLQRMHQNGATPADPQFARIAAATDAKLRQVEHALQLLNRGCGDCCEDCGQPLPATRLAQTPQLTRCDDCATATA